MKKETWVLVANSSVAKIYKAENNQTLKEIANLEHPESRLPEHELVSSRPGRSFDSLGKGRHAMEQQTSPHMQEFMLFARELTQLLEEAFSKGKIGRLYVVANPQFLGLLRQSFSHHLASLVASEVDKDMTHLKPAEIRTHLPLVL